MLAIPGSEVLWVEPGGLCLRPPPGVEKFSLSPDNVWYGRLKLLFSLSVQIDGQDDPVQLECAYISFFYDIRLEPSGEHQHNSTHINMY